MNSVKNLDTISYNKGFTDACNFFKVMLKDEDRLISYVAQERILKRINELTADKSIEA